MRFRLFKMGIEGKIAIANLIAIAALLVAFLIAFPSGVIDVDSTPKGMLVFARVLEVMVATLSFPVGWLSMVFTPLDAPPFMAVVFVPLNAYLWGYVTAAIARWRKARRVQSGTANARTSRL